MPFVGTTTAMGASCSVPLARVEVFAKSRTPAALAASGAWSGFCLAPLPGVRDAKVFVDERGGARLEVMMLVSDRTTGLPLSLLFATQLPHLDGFLEGPARRRALATALRRGLVEALAHEVDECLRGDDGEILFDPHAGGT
jgi:hypothetical protein